MQICFNRVHLVSVLGKLFETSEYKSQAHQIGTEKKIEKGSRLVDPRDSITIMGADSLGSHSI